MVKSQRNTVSIPDAGRIDYGYNAFGELEWQKDARGKEYTMNYDILGRIDTKTYNDTITKYEYVTDADENGLGQLSRVSVAKDHVSTTYSYDGLGRVTKIKETVVDQVFEAGYTYNGIGKLEDQLYPTQNGERFKITHEYDSNGYLKKVKKADGSAIWEMQQANAPGQVKQYKQGNALTTTKEYDAYGMPSHIQTSDIQHFDYQFDAATGNLASRTDVYKTLTESFTYDNLNRLKTVRGNNDVLKQALDYLENGNIDTISGIGKLYYAHLTKKHAVTGIDNRANLVPEVAQSIKYTSFNKVASVKEPDGTNQLEFLYGADQQRRRTVYTNNGQQKTTWFIGNYEKEVTGGTTRELHYINGGDGLAAVYIKTNGTGVLYYILKDHLGSIQYICNESGQKLEELSFDAWGRRRNPANWLYSNVPAPQYLTRGFTGHEHLDGFSLINMNGRVYDPLLGRMLSPDPYVQMPDFTQNLNRYSYCLNNPLKFTDPSGYTWWSNFKDWVNKGWDNLGAWWSKNDIPMVGVNMSGNGTVPFASVPVNGNTDISIGYNLKSGNWGIGNNSSGFNSFYYPTYKYNQLGQNVVENYDEARQTYGNKLNANSLNGVAFVQGELRFVFPISGSLGFTNSHQVGIMMDRGLNLSVYYTPTLGLSGGGGLFYGATWGIMFADDVKQLKGLGTAVGIALGNVSGEINTTGIGKDWGFTAPTGASGGFGFAGYSEITWTLMTNPINIGKMTFEDLANYLNYNMGASYNAQDVFYMIQKMNSLY